MTGKTMQGQNLNLQTFKKLREPHGFPFMSANDLANNNNNPPSLKKNQYISSYKGGLLCLPTILQDKKKKQGSFGKR
jgi:hypothetical protein